MLIYWLLFGYFAIGALVERPEPAVAGVSTPNRGPMLSFGGVLITLMIGLRYRVGADWVPYVEMFRSAGRTDFRGTLRLGDPAYQSLNWLVQQIGWELWVVNLVCGAIFASGLVRLARVLPRPWLAMTIAVPYLVIVVAMGYTRQGVALGIIMAGLASYLRTGGAVRYLVYVLVAALFHKTAILAFPLVVIGGGNRKLVTALIAAAISYSLYDLVLAPSVDRMLTNYASYQSQGALIRIVMSCFAALLFLVRKRHLELSVREHVIWRNFSVAALAFLGVLFAAPGSSAGIDRVALYVIPLQLAILSRPRVTGTTIPFGIVLLVSYAALVQFTWLNFAQHSEYWVPYRLWPLLG
ncbi:EpsG-like putative glucosyltransferase [Sphingomonas sp. F9_3S_D5_B_2]